MGELIDEKSGLAVTCAGDAICVLPQERSPWGRATDPPIARRFAAAWVEGLYRVERKGRFILGMWLVVV
jgi:hypothetical protein